MGSMILMYAVTGYIFAMFALYMLGTAKLIQKEGKPPLLFAFLPFAHGYARAVIVGQRGRYLRIFAPMSAAYLLIALLFPNIIILATAGIFYIVTRCFLNFYTFSRKHAPLFTILSILIPLSGGIWIYYTSRKEETRYDG